MSRFKYLTAMVSMALAMSGLVGVASASATDRSLTISGDPAKFTVSVSGGSAYPAMITNAKQESANTTFVLGDEGPKIQCDELSVLGMRWSAFISLPMGANISGCNAYATGPAEVITDGCNYTFNLEEEEGIEYPGTLELECEENDVVKVAVAFGGYAICSVSIPAQELADATYISTSAAVFTFLDGEEIEYETEHTSGYGFLCGEEGVHNDGSFYSSLILEAVDD